MWGSMQCRERGGRSGWRELRAAGAVRSYVLAFATLQGKSL